MFIDGFLALCSAVGSGTCTELSGGIYARQPISFSTPVSGMARNAVPWTFGSNIGATPMAGRAIFDAPVAGNLMLVMPHFVTRPVPMGGPVDAGDVGDIALSFTALASYPNGAAFTGLLPAGSTVGSCNDNSEIIGTYTSPGGAPAGASVIPSRGLFQFVYSSPLTVGPLQLVISRGVLQVQARAQGVE